jgi:hypothetical protein
VDRPVDQRRIVPIHDAHSPYLPPPPLQRFYFF